MVLVGISLGHHTNSHGLHGETITALKYRDEILNPSVRPYAGPIVEGSKIRKQVVKFKGKKNPLLPGEVILMNARLLLLMDSSKVSFALSKSSRGLNILNCKI
ncbi:hypothetical protein AVEN_201504-1 [Araneus ventricosus]|uniref:Uncharacterized protein n=1 Tax=Araneus ventricosus TaxID=182803 RepID=A0A4Y2UN88_ARAVE|nr:hypothetical protein AVEN_273091-1 [Araneus ventricosus]GBO13591.1 hypothetical protein AVEN_201504-1 [Araneus ventricosus]